jgi:hypothetical protein
MQELERSVVRGRRRRRGAVIAAISAVAVGVGASVAVWAWPPPEPTRIVVEHFPPPIVVNVATPPPAPLPPAEPAPPPPTGVVACPVVDTTADSPLGVLVKHPTTPTDYDGDDDPRFRVVVAGAAKRIAIHADNRVLVSDDDGGAFFPAFAHHDVMQIAVAPDGTLYAIDGDQLGVRATLARPGAQRGLALEQGLQV